MAQAVLLVERDDVRRGQLRSAFTSRGVPVYEVADAVDAMVAIGRGDFGALLASEGKRHLSLRGLCLLARRRHPGIRVVVLVQGDVSAEEMRARLGVEVDLLPGEPSAREAADAVLAFAPALLSPFDVPAATEVQRRPSRFGDDEPRTDSGSAPTWHAPPAPALSAPTAPEAPSSSDATTRIVAAPREDFGEATLLDERTDLEQDDSSVPSLDDVEPVPDEPAGVPDETVVDARQPPGFPFASTDDPRGGASFEEVWRRAPGFVEPADTDPASGGHRAPAALLPEEGVILEGALQDLGGAPLLVGIFAQELTGRLELSLPRGHVTFYFHVGEPVGAAHPMGDAGFYEALFARGDLVGDRQRPSAPEGQLFGALLERGALTGERLHEFLRTWIEERLDELLVARRGSFRFLESAGFLDTLPLCRVDPFEVLRREQERRIGLGLPAVAARVAQQWMWPTRALAVCAPRMTPFSGGRDLAAVIGDGALVHEVTEALGKSPIEGALLAHTLEAARLVELKAVPPPDLAPPPGIVVLETAPTVKVARVPDANDSGERSREQAALREEIFSLYLRLKPLTRPAQVLGVPLDAGRDEVEQAYRERMALLDPARVAAGPQGDLVRSRIEELRAKVGHAYEALRLQLESTGKNLPARRRPKDDSNPW